MIFEANAYMKYSNKTHIILLRNKKRKWEIKTEEVCAILPDPDSESELIVHFKLANRAGQNVFPYKRRDVVVLEYPKVLNPEEFDFYVDRKKLNNIYAAFHFSDTKGEQEYWSFAFKSNKHDFVCEAPRVIARRSRIAKKSTSAISYLQTLAFFMGYPIRTKVDDEIVLVKEFEKILSCKEKPLFDAFLNPGSFCNDIIDEGTPIIFPYGINSSQVFAVQNAFSNRISIIQGPPGTGKTQTIMNIISNIVIRNKNVLVVAGCNSAIDNVLEKLREEGNDISLIAARMGNSDCRKSFFNKTFDRVQRCPTEWALEANPGKITELVEELMPLLNQNTNYFRYLHSDDPSVREKCPTIKRQLDEADLSGKVEELTSLSMCFLKNHLYHRYEGRHRCCFSEDDLSDSYRSGQLLSEYPVILSTAYSSTCCKEKSVLFDYVIFDESSQIDVLTGLLALSCARNAVIVGDEKQLPNVVTEHNRRVADELFGFYNLDDRFNYSHYSFLGSIIKTFGSKIVQKTLVEHYRCHPRIAKFFNEKFYDGELVIMREPDKRKDVLMLRKTVPGNHACLHLNHREEEEIEELKNYYHFEKNSADIGIVTPYDNQVSRIDNDCDIEEDILVSTVHKFQGRQRSTIIFSTVDNHYLDRKIEKQEDFVNNRNLVNVTISRAANRFILVTNGNEGNSGLVHELAEYIEREGGIIEEGHKHSVFDCLYKGYEDKFNEYLRTHPLMPENILNKKPSRAEKLAYAFIADVLRDFTGISVEYEYPLRELVPNEKDTELLCDELVDEVSYVNNPASHIDYLFLKGGEPIMALEIDGNSYHEPGSRHSCNDAMKDRIVKEVCNIPIFRMGTKESVDEEIKLPFYLKFALAAHGLSQNGRYSFECNKYIRNILSKGQHSQLTENELQYISQTGSFVHLVASERIDGRFVPKIAADLDDTVFDSFIYTKTELIKIREHLLEDICGMEYHLFIEE